MRIRKRIEEPFGWIKTIGGGRKLRYLGRQRNRAWFQFTAALYDLIRITALDARPARPVPDRQTAGPSPPTPPRAPSRPPTANKHGGSSPAWHPAHRREPLNPRFSAPC